MVTDRATDRPLDRPTIEQLAHDIVYVLTGFPLAIISFTLMVTGLSLSAGLLVTLVGLPVAAATLGVARMIALVERARLRGRGARVPRPVYRELPEHTSVLRRWIEPLRDTQNWLDVAHGLLVFPLATVTFSVVLTWLVGAAAGLTFWLWGRWLPASDSSLTDPLGLRLPETALNGLIGLAFALTLVPIARICAGVQAGLGMALLANPDAAALRQRVATLSATRAAAADAEVASLRRLERDIHDGPQQRLVRTGMDLSVAERRMHSDPDEAARLVAQARDQVAEALAELRALSRGIAPPILADRGLGPALAAVAARSTVPVELEVAAPPTPRLPAAVENGAYFMVCEALANVAKHSDARRARVQVFRSGGLLVVEVEDDGRGGAALAKGQGLAGLADRLAGQDGTLTVSSPAGGPTVVRAEIPCG